MKTIDYKKQGKRNRAAGQRFELKVRKDLEEKEWVVDRWSNNVEFRIPNAEEINKALQITGSGFAAQRVGKLIKAKSFMGRSRTNGFPDFISFKIRSGYSYYDEDEKMIDEYLQPTYDRIVIGVECKSNGTLSKIEKQKCQWYLDNNVFSKILIAEKTKPSNKIVIVYHDFKEKYGK